MGEHAEVERYSPSTDQFSAGPQQYIDADISALHDSPVDLGLDSGINNPIKGLSTTNGYAEQAFSEQSSGTSGMNSGPPSSSSDFPVSLEDVAIVGMACRTAGDINTPEKLWKFLLDKQNGSGEVPTHRWEPWLGRGSQNAKEIDKTLRKGYFVDRLEYFDASFFGISPKEAEQMDPHQRLALELSWEALEHAGINPKDLSKSDTAVYMGVDSDDYSRLLLEDLPNIEPWMGIGTAAHGVANRISYHLDLMGSSAAVDAACASSLVAVHWGSRAIQLRESEVAIVGGVNVLLAPALTRMLDKAGALSPEGICRSFDDAANGYARGEGGAILVLKRLSSALRDGDHVWATLKGSAVAQDGKTNGIMAPNSDAQELVGRLALSRAGFEPSSISYVEAHATSTPLGDPTEIAAISRLYGSGAQRQQENPCQVGSIKPNVGHLEAAAGAIGLIKAVLSVQKGMIAPQASLQKLNSRVDWAKSGLEIVQETMTWKQTHGLRRAAVCSYGYGGTVSHAIIEQGPVFDRQHTHSPESDTSKLLILIITAPHAKRLEAQAQALADWLDSANGRASELGAVANTLAQRRALHGHRLVILAKSHEDAFTLLRRAATKSVKKEDPVVVGRAFTNQEQRDTAPVWVFSGHGAQWFDMGKELLLSPVFCAAISEVEDLIQAEIGFSVLQILQRGDFESSIRAQVATFAVQLGLARVLASYGLHPSSVVGHSIGEITASVISGAITAAEGAIIITRRAKLLAQIVADDEPGAMALVQLPFNQVKTELDGRKEIVAAIDSSPLSCVVSGPTEAVSRYLEELEARDIGTFNVRTDIAFHSPMMNQLQDPLRGVLDGDIRPCKPTIPIYSTSLDDPRTTRLRDADYWVNNMVNPVRLRSAVEAAAEDGHRLFLEVSSHPIVLHSLQEILGGVGLKENETFVAYTMRRNTSPKYTIKLAMAQLLACGSSIDWSATLGHRSNWNTDVPSTVWFQKPFYRQVSTHTGVGDTIHDVDSHTLLGRCAPVAELDLKLYDTRLSIDTKPFSGSHPLDGTEIIPAGVYINTFRHATGGCVFENIQLLVPVPMTKDIRKVQVVVQQDTVFMASTMTQSSSKASVNGESWTKHARCQWSGSIPNAQSTLPVDISAVRNRIGTKLSDSFAVDFLTSIGVSGIAFPWKVTEHYGNEVEMLAEVDMLPGQDTLPWDRYSWAPVLDAATSVGSSIFFTEKSLRIISSMRKVSLHSEDPLPKVIYLHIEDASDKKSLAANVRILDESGHMLAQIQSMEFSEVERGADLRGRVETLVHQIDWVPARFTETPRPIGNVILISKDSEQVTHVRSWIQSSSSDIYHVSNAEQLLSSQKLRDVMCGKGSSVVYLPEQIGLMEEVPDGANRLVWEVVELLRCLTECQTTLCKLFVLTTGVHDGSSNGLAQGALVGLGRIIAEEHPDVWGGLIDRDSDEHSCLLAMMYVQGQDIVRNMDGLPRRAVMRPLSRKLSRPAQASKSLLPKAQGAYIITGGLGSLGLDTADFLVGKGGRRILLISRRTLPARSSWARLISEKDEQSNVLQRIQRMESVGATVSTLALDMSLPNAAETLLQALDTKQLPPVLGVIHCAGVLEDGLVLQTTQESLCRVMAPKIKGAMALHRAFPVGTLDFFILFSSIGQLVGTAGQASYGAGNAFLDTLAVNRRASGDNAVAMQFSAWRDSAMASSTEFLTVELESKGITDISSEEAFRAWEHLGKFDLASAVVTRCRAIDYDQPVAKSILEEIVVRKPRSSSVNPGSKAEDCTAGDRSALSRPTDPEDLRRWLAESIRLCIATVLMMPDITEIDGGTMMNDLGIDSVMTVALRRRFQDVFKIKVPPTLTWQCPTVDRMVPWFASKLQEDVI